VSASPQIVLVHVIEPLPNGACHWSDPTQILERSANDARIRLERFTQRARLIYPKCTNDLHFGIVPRVVAQVARELKIDLIVVAGRSQPGFFDRLMRSLAERLVGQAPCPVITVQVDGIVDSDLDLAARA